MAHLTLALLNYRLSEGAGSLLNYTRVCMQSFTRGMDSGEGILDAFVVGCVVFALVVMAAVNLFLRGSNWLSAVKSLIPGIGRTLSRQRKASSAVAPTDSVWVNSFLNWQYLHGDRVPQLIPFLLRRLTEESARISETFSIGFDDILPGSLPPKVLSVQADTDTTETLVIKAKVELTDVCIAVRVLHHDANAATDAAAYRGTWSLRELQTEVRLSLSYNDGVFLLVQLIVPEVPALGVFTYDGKQAGSCKPTPALLDAHVRRLLMSTALACRPECHPVATTITDFSNEQQWRIVAAAPLEQPHLQTTGKLSSRSHDARAAGASKLLVKVHKATGLSTASQSLTGTEQCPSWFCTIELDRPLQARQSAAVPTPLCPTWSEEFTFDLERNSKCLAFAVYDKTRVAFDGLPLRAFLVIDDIFTMPPSKPLDGIEEQSRVIELPLLMSQTNGTTNGKLVIEASFITMPRSAGTSDCRGVTREMGALSDMPSAEGLSPGTMEAQEPGLTPQKQRDQLSVPSMAAQAEEQSCPASDNWAVHTLSSSHDQDARVAKVRNDTEVLVVSPDMIVEVAKQKLTQQAKQQIVPGSRTTTIIVTSLHKVAAGDVPGSSGAVGEPASELCSDSVCSSGTSSTSSSSSAAASGEDAAAGRSASAESPKDDDQRIPSVESAGSADANGKSRGRSGNSYSLHKLEAKSEVQLKPEAALEVNGSHGESPVNSTSATDVRPKHKLSGLRKFLSFRKKPKPDVDATHASPSKSKKH